MKNSKIVIEKVVFKSEAFRSLKTDTAIKVYMDFLMKRQMQKLKVSRKNRSDIWEITNNGKIEYTYSEAQKKGFTKPRFQRALDELIEKGFIDIARLGGMFEGDKTLYSISTRWQKYGTDKFEVKVRPKDTRKGKGFAVFHAKRKKREEMINLAKENIKRRKKEKTKKKELVKRKKKKYLVQRVV